ncbi:MAG: DUF4105 domain-containing protein [Spirochaetales bacterium]|nr:DUF4105 domain-containing protein [Spirochaetales bacterium]
MKKILAFALLLLSLLPIFSVSIAGRDSIAIREDLFYSEKELNKFGMDKKATGSAKDYIEECEVYLLTGGPGSIVWENFGHSSFIVEHPGGEFIAYDYGIFAFDDDFFKNFALGRLYYEAWETWADYRVESFIEDDRTVSVLPLDLDVDQKYSLITFLEYNTRPENSVYLYDYYYDNCATRLRDSYNAITGGEFRKWAESIIVDETLRNYSQRYLSRSTFPVCFAINYLLGPSVDKEITLWEAMFLPEVLEAAIREYQGNESTVYYETIGRKDTPAKYGFLARTLAMGAIAAILIQLSHSNRKWIRKISDSFAIVVYLILTLMTLVLAFLMTSSIHFVTYFNLNVLITLPSVAMLYLHIRALFDENRFRPAIKKFAGISFRITLIVFAIKAVFSFIAIQDCLAYFTFMLMLYMAEIYEIKGTSKGN